MITFGGYSENVAASLGGECIRSTGTLDMPANRVTYGLTLIPWVTVHFNDSSPPGSFNGNTYSMGLALPSALAPRSKNAIQDGNIATDRLWQ